MFKVLVVDDEVLERKALSKIIKSSSTDVELVGEAPNGRLAIEMAKEHRPDIIFMDIKMPSVDGVEAVREIKKLDLSIRFIMVSAFNTFEYAKEVMQQGVKEYLLKPSSKQDILSSLERVKLELLEEKKQLEEQQSLRENLDRAVGIAQKEWIASLLINQDQDITFSEWGELIGVELVSGYFMLFSLQPKGKSGAPTPHELQQWYAWLNKALKQVVQKQEIMIGPMTETQVPVLLLNKNTREKVHFKTGTLSIINDLVRHFQEESFIGELKVGIGLPYSKANELNKSYHEASQALRQIMKEPKQRYLFGTKQSNTEQSESGILVVEKKLLEAVRQGDINQVHILFNSYVSMLTTEKHSEGRARKSLEELFILISRMFYDLGINYERTLPLEESEDLHILFEKGKSHLMAAVKTIQVWRNSHAKGILHKAKEYIEVHYSEAITLESVAEYVELSPFYFSKLFKDRFGMTFIDYLTEVRIERAKAEMLGQGKSLKEICYAVGYKDPNYFSRVFKKHTGLSPSEFRKKHGDGSFASN